MKESISSRLFYFSRNQRFAVGILLLLILGFLVFRFWMQERETVTESIQEYEQFQSEIEAFKSQLETKPLSSKTKIQKKKICQVLILESSLYELFQKMLNRIR